VIAQPRGAPVECGSAAIVQSYLSAGQSSASTAAPPLR